MSFINKEWVTKYPNIFFHQESGQSKTRQFAMLLALIVTSILFCTESNCHVKWFVDTATASVEGFQAYSITDTPVLIWIGIVFTLISISLFLDSKLPSINLSLNKDGSNTDPCQILRVLTGISLLLTSYDGSLLAPHLSAHGNLGTVLILLQAFIGILLLGNCLLGFAGILLISLFLSSFYQFGFFSIIEYCGMIGIALYFLFHSVSSANPNSSLRYYAVAVLRIWSGLSLVILAFSEKLIGAMYGEAFVQTYQWNFMQMLGFDFYTDRLLVLSAGMMEIVIGVILIFGTTMKLNILALASIMILSNSVFLFQGNPQDALTELIGHLPILATGYVLLTINHEPRLKITNLFNRKTAKLIRA